MPIALAILAIVGLAAYALTRNTAGVSDSSGDTSGTGDTTATDITSPVPSVPVIAGGENQNVATINALDRNTWPSGDAVWRFCQAIAHAEGYGADPNNVPTVRHNPGDLGPGDTGYPGAFTDGSNVSYMPDDATGWQALYAKISRIFNGNSSAYPNTLTILQMAQKYAGDWKNWSNNVSIDLGVSQDTRLIDWYNAQ